MSVDQTMALVCAVLAVLAGVGIYVRRNWPRNPWKGSNMTVHPIAAALRGRLVVSVQAYQGEPLRRPEIMATMARACELGGAAAVRPLSWARHCRRPAGADGVAPPAFLRSETLLQLLSIAKEKN